MKKNYQEIVKEFEKLDYRELSKAIFYFEKSFELKEQHNLNEQQTNEVLDKAYDFFMQSDLAGSFVDERLLNAIDRFVNEALDKENDLKESQSTIRKRHI